jgi:3',5'-cyclic AMP phosphodiesterase CpdA
MNRNGRVVVIGFLASVLVGCGGDVKDPEDPTPTAPTYALTAEPYTTLQAVWRPTIPSESTTTAIAEGTLTAQDLDQFEAAGLGVTLEEGHPWVERNDLAPEYDPATAGDRRSLLYLWQSADSQLIDEESPIRFEAFEEFYRPQGHLTTQVFEAHVRTARAINDRSGRPFDWAVMAGDLTDGSQRNEFIWFLTAVNGGVIDPDSGADDDPVPGPGNDYNDPFFSDGLPVPWFAALGNHETQYNGGFGILDDEIREAAASDAVYQSGWFTNGFRDGSTLNAEVRTEGPTPADPERVPQRIGEALELLFEADGEPQGHGLTAEDVAANRAYFSLRPIPDRPIRLITLQTVDPDAGIGAGAMGFIDDEQFAWLEAELTAADAAHELIIILSHHRIEDIAGNSPIAGYELAATLAASDGVVLHLAGHGHFNDGDPHSHDPESIADFGYWELMVSSTLDFPMHSRILEIVNDDNGYLSVYITNIGHNSPPGSLAHEGRSLAAAAKSFNGFYKADDLDAFWAKDSKFHNMLLRIPIPEAVQTELSQHDWPTRIESETTLMSLTAPSK